eukprot:6551382-Alexandrium_andersonii.AAC.1
MHACAEGTRAPPEGERTKTESRSKVKPRKGHLDRVPSQPCTKTQMPGELPRASTRRGRTAARLRSGRRPGAQQRSRRQAKEAPQDDVLHVPPEAGTGALRAVQP